MSELNSEVMSELNSEIMSEENEIIEIHYNFFETIKEQLKKQNYKCKNINLYDKAKDSIIYLYVHNILTDSEKEKCINKLHKQILKDIIVEDK